MQFKQTLLTKTDIQDFQAGYGIPIVFVINEMFMI